MYNNFEVITLADSILRDKAKVFVLTNAMLVLFDKHMKKLDEFHRGLNILMRSTLSSRFCLFSRRKF